MPDEPGEHRAREVDALHAVERRAAVRAEEHAAAHLDVVAGDAERVEPPRQVEQPDQQEQDAQHDQHGDQVEVVRDDEVDRVAAAELLASTSTSMSSSSQGRKMIDQTVAQVRDHESRDDDQEQPAAEQRGQRMQAMPLAVARASGRAARRLRAARRARSPRRAGSWSKLAHRPVRRVLGDVDERVAQLLGRLLREPRDHHAGGRGGGHELELRDAEPAVERSVGDVDELHAAVGHGDDALPQDAAAEHEVVAAQLVADTRAPAGE